METFIDAKHLSKKYGTTQALDDVTFSLEADEVVGLIGPNGAGKSTLLKALLGLVRFEGDLEVLGQSPRRNRAGLLESLSYIADVASLPEWISVNRLLDFMDGVHPGFDRQRALQFLDRTQVTVRHKVKGLSKGMKTQLHLALIMGVDSRLLILDEPTLGLDIVFRTEFYDALISEYHNSQRAILITTHQVEEIENYLTRVMFIHHGRIVFDMATGDLADRYTQLTVGREALSRARGFKPIYVREIGQNAVLIFENQDSTPLEELGTVQNPGLADLFVALVKGEERA